MITCDVLSPHDLSPSDVETWRDMTVQTPAFASPILSPEFCAAVARVRDDVAVAVYRQGGKPVAYLAHHRRPHRFARPVGAPFADYTALISYPDPPLNARDALQLAGLRALQVAGLTDPHGAFEDFTGESEDAFGIDLTLGDGTDTNNVDKKHLKNINRLRRKLEADHGEIRFVTPDFTPAHFEAMLAIKRAQTVQTGIHDFLAPDWVQALMRNLFTPPTEGLETGLYGHMTTVMAGDQPIIWHFGPRLRGFAHPWISAFDPAFSVYSPGQIFLQGCQQPLRAAGIDYYDLSTGQQHYKNTFCNTHTQVYHGRLYAGATEGRPQALSRLWPSRGAASVFNRLGRRLDHMASLELDWQSRLRGTLFAVSSAGKRLRPGA